MPPPTIPIRPQEPPRSTVLTQPPPQDDAIQIPNRVLIRKKPGSVTPGPVLDLESMSGLDVLMFNALYSRDPDDRSALQTNSEALPAMDEQTVDDPTADDPTMDDIFPSGYGPPHTQYTTLSNHPRNSHATRPSETITAQPAALYLIDTTPFDEGTEKALYGAAFHKHQGTKETCPVCSVAEAGHKHKVHEPKGFAAAPPDDMDRTLKKLGRVMNAAPAMRKAPEKGFEKKK